MEITEIAPELRLVLSFHGCVSGPTEQGIHETGFECFTQLRQTTAPVPSLIYKCARPI
jgi:hypothetical protein